MKEKGNRKSQAQKSNRHQLPQLKGKRKATITISPDLTYKVDIETGNVSDLEMYKYLRDMTEHFAKVLCSEAEEVVGEDADEQIKYLNWRIEQSGLN